jgi:hypothetical protein
MTLELHPWGHFKPGAWKLYRVVTETFDEHGAVVNTSVTYSKTTLKSAEERNCVALEIEAVVEVAGKTLDTAPKMVKQGLHGTSPEEAGNVKKLPTAELVIEGRKIPCEVEQVESSDSSGRTITKTWYSQAVAPYVLRRESKTTDLEGKTVTGETVLEVTSLQARCEWLPRGANGARVTVVSTHSKGKTITKAITSTEVPGGVVCHTADELDRDGHLIRRSTLSLIDYGAESRRDRSGLFSRIRNRAHRTYRPATPDEQPVK